MSQDVNPPRRPGILRCATWNLWWRFAEPDRRALAIRDELRDLDADVVGLQEVWSTPERNLARWLGDQLGMYVAWAPLRLPGRWRRRVPDTGQVEAGNAVLSRWELRDVASYELDGPPAVDEAPLVLSTTVACPAGELRFCCTHLTSGMTASATRMRQVERLATHVTAHRVAGPWPLVVVGDFNAEPDSDEMRRLGGHLTTPAVPHEVFIDAWRYHEGHGPGWTWDRTNPHVREAAEPSARVDYVFLSPDRDTGPPDVDSVGRFGTSARAHGWPSDHAGVWVDLRLE